MVINYVMVYLTVVKKRMKAIAVSLLALHITL
jgi:hypothetical protein